MKVRALVLFFLIASIGCKADKKPNQEPEMVVVHRAGHSFAYDPAACRAATEERDLARDRLAQCREVNPVEFTRCDRLNSQWSNYKHQAEI
ncbi:MAG TPA: hypothetical protein VE222_08000, partial [Nitrospiraceae bacterium]|nr:hypothetical protein [Nitrospiraceae bacterium]